jgi:GntR family transcriptional repressor for pyruvate dehydrogenase complex
MSAADAVGFEPVSRATISSQIRDQLLASIRSGALQPGTRLPSERDLSEQFQVARTSVREAMQGLRSIGVIERRGNRSFVVERLPDLSFDEADGDAEFVRQLFETRRLLEVPIIEFATQRASDEQRSHICILADRFGKGMPLSEFLERDREFHAAIAEACGNPLLVEVYGKVVARLSRSPGLEPGDEAGRIVDSATEEHAALARAVAEGDVATAGACGIAHLASVERELIDRMA